MVERQRQAAERVGKAAGAVGVLRGLGARLQVFDRRDARKNADRQIGDAVPARPARGDQHMRATARGEKLDVAGLFDIVVDQQPGLVEARLPERIDGALGVLLGFGGIAAQAGVKALAEADQLIEHFAALLAADDGDASVAVEVALRIFVGQHRFADAAQARQRRSARRVGERGRAGGPQRVLKPGQFVAAAGEIGIGADGGVDKLRRPASQLGEVDLVRRLAEPAGAADDCGEGGHVAEMFGEVSERNVGQVLDRQAIGDAQHDHALIEVARIGRQRDLVFLLAVLGGLVSARQHADQLGAARPALGHHGHEAGVAEVLVLQEGVGAGLAQGAGDEQRGIAVGAVAADEEVDFVRAQRD